jgi:hypothetical protein
MSVDIAFALVLSDQQMKTDEFEGPQGSHGHTDGK